MTDKQPLSYANEVMRAAHVMLNTLPQYGDTVIVVPIQQGGGLEVNQDLWFQTGVSEVKAIHELLIYYILDNGQVLHYYPQTAAWSMEVETKDPAGPTTHSTIPVLVGLC